MHTTDLSAGYALGALSPDERARVDAHIAECTPCRDDIGEMLGIVSTLPLAPQSVEPPDDLKARVLAAAAAEARAGESLRRKAAVDVTPVAGGSGDQFLAGNGWRQAAAWWPWLATAAAIVLGITTLNTMHERDAVRARLVVAAKALEWARVDNASLHGQLAAARSTIDRAGAAEAVVAALAAGTYRAESPALDRYGKPWRCTVVQPRGHNGMLVASIPEPPRGMAYQVWLRRGTRAHKAGMIMHGGMAMLTMPMPFERGDVVAFSVEHPAGALAPTMPYVMEVSI